MLCEGERVRGGEVFRVRFHKQPTRSVPQYPGYAANTSRTHLSPAETLVLVCLLVLRVMRKQNKLRSTVSMLMTWYVPSVPFS